MKYFIFCILFYISSALAESPSQSIEVVLDQLHTAAAKADGKLYFSLFSENAVYIGTDAKETWTLEQFRQFAEPYFSKGKGWTYTATQRHVYLSQGGDTAWFDELLWNSKYGVCRGTGVLERIKGQWKIAQYHLTIPIPNELADDIVKQIKEPVSVDKKNQKN